jgi:hypothetical protein
MHWSDELQHMNCWGELTDGYEKAEMRALDREIMR